MKLIDNINDLLGDDIKQSVQPGARLKIAASCFSIYAYEALKRELESVESFEFIFTSPSFMPDEATDVAKKERREFHIPKPPSDAKTERSFYGTEFEVQLKNKLTQRAIARECADWMRRKAKFRTNSGNAPMQQFAAVQTDGAVGGAPNAVYMPLHGFTAVDLGYQPGNAVSNIVNKFDEPANTGVFLSLFDQIWADPAKLNDVTSLVCEHIASVYQENSPERIYFLMLYNIFNEFLEDLNEDVLPNDRTGYLDTLVWQKLFNFQRDAATGIINKLETYNGCILADSVGLGKTFTALAVIKYYELRNRSVLVLCPKKLADNWLTYNRNLKTNIFAKDRFNYEVLCHTDLQRTSGESFGTPLNRVNWGNYDLVVIDESHNFRNNDAYKDKETRYQKLMDSVIRQGVKTKVLMLSATPVNNRFNDLRNQLALAYEGNSLQLGDKLHTEKDVEEIFRRAQAAFNNWTKLPPEERTANAILGALDFDFFELLDSVTIARSRKHIETFYDTKDIGTFPERLKPLSFHCPLTLRTDVIGFNDIFNQLSLLKLDDFQSRRPIDVISANRPILFLDEPQKMEGGKTLDSLANFKPLAVLRYSATHKTTHNKIHRLDALDAYNQKLVKKIAVRGISVKGLTGTNAYLYLESIEVSTSAPVARVELEIKQNNGPKRVLRKLSRTDNLFDISGGMEQYRGFVVADINALTNTLSFTNGQELVAGEATGDVSESALRRIQIREAVKAHFEKEQALFAQGIKVLSLFFIDAVSKYRSYDDAGERNGEYAQMFEEEYNLQLAEVMTLEDTPYNRYLKGIATARTHEGYFSIDKKSKRMVDPETGKKSTETDDVDAYDLILRKKEQLLKFEEPVRFIFSHSALREGWDNPNVFVICTLKHSDNTISRRQEVGRGLRLSVNQHGDRMDAPATVHQVNVLTVVASESYKDFVTALQRDMSEGLSERPRVADESYFTGKVLKTSSGDVEVTPQLAKQIYKYLLKNDYTDDKDRIADAYHEAKKEGTLAALPPDLVAHAEAVFALIDTVFSDTKLPLPEDDRKAKTNPLNGNFEKTEFKALWSRINRKAAYTVDFETPELVAKCVKALEAELKVSPMQYTVVAGEQAETATYDGIRQGESFKVTESTTDYQRASAHSAVKYDLIGRLADETQLTRATVASILQGINKAVFSQYRTNPEDFMRKAARLMNEQKATVIVEHIAYDPTGETHTMEIFTQDKPKEDFSKAVKANHHIYDYVFTDSKNERDFVRELDASTEVVVYAKLPRGFFIPTPVGNYNPDWAIAFQEGKVKHVYFVAETKGSMSSMDLRKIEESKIECARKFFAKITSDQVKYEVVDGYGKLMELVA